MNYYRNFGGGVSKNKSADTKVTVRFLDKKTGKVREFKAKVKRSKYSSTEDMIHGMANNGMHPEMITQAVMKREKLDKPSAKKLVLSVEPSLKTEFKKKRKRVKSKSASKSKKRKSNRPSRRNKGGARTFRAYYAR